MATAFDIRFRALAVRLIAKFGVTIGNGVVVRYTPGVMDQATGKIVVAEDSQTVPMSPPVDYKKGDIDGTNIQEDDFIIYIAGADWDDAFPAEELKPHELLTVNGISTRVIQPNPIYSGDLIAAYAAQCRRGQDA